jgi:hypothetical protein
VLARWPDPARIHRNQEGKMLNETIFGMGWCGRTILRGLQGSEKRRRGGAPDAAGASDNVTGVEQ